MFPLRRPVEPDRLIDLKDFAAWVQDCRRRKGWSLEILARHISDAGYPISQNKLYRIEQHLKEGPERKRPLRTIDYELKMRLEAVLGEPFAKGRPPANAHDGGRVGAGPDDSVSAARVIEIIQDLKASRGASSPPDTPVYRRIYDALKQAFVDDKG